MYNLMAAETAKHTIHPDVVMIVIGCAVILAGLIWISTLEDVFRGKPTWETYAATACVTLIFDVGLALCAMGSHRWTGLGIVVAIVGMTVMIYATLALYVTLNNVPFDAPIPWVAAGVELLAFFAGLGITALAMSV